MTKLRLLISESVDPWFNLAVEETIFSNMNPDQKVLFLWRNDGTVVIGRAQNPWKECNTRKMDEDGVKLARRQSGGGAVFHDLGNTNFTFMAGKPDYNKDTSTQIILDALKSLGIDVKASGRNDLIIEREDIRKISGSAYREKADRGFHHGTLLLDVDFTRLTNYLNPDPKKLQAKGISSVRSRVANLTEILPEITHEQICAAIQKAFFDYYGEQVEPEWISEKHPPNIEGFIDQFNVQSSWEWNFGRALEFNHQMDERFVWGGVDIQLVVNSGMITEAQIYSDSLDLEPLEWLSKALVGCPYKVNAIEKLFDQLLQNYSDRAETLTELRKWFIQEIK